MERLHRCYPILDKITDPRRVSRLSLVNVLFNEICGVIAEQRLLCNTKFGLNTKRNGCANSGQFGLCPSSESL